MSALSADLTTRIGVELFTAAERRVISLPPAEPPRREVIDELWRVLREGGRAAREVFL